MPRLTVSEASDKSGLSTALIRRAIAEGKLAAKRVGNTWTFTEVSFQAWRRNVRDYTRKNKE